MMGDRYGFRPIPSEIAAVEYDLLRLIADELRLEGRTLLDAWYMKDENSVPVVYVLQVDYL